MFVPITFGFAAKWLTQYAWLSRTTCPRSWRSSSGSMPRPIAGWTPKVGKKFCVICIPYSISGGTSPEIVYGMQITQNFFPTLGVQPAIGRGMLPEEDRQDRGHVVLLSHAYWVSHFAANPK